ncbi:TetR/AcrR family transcriptional regulator [Alteromonas sp. 5E99-2]|uniref:TetR/AcrR family transcriptional regulator n=1 Tax=Alteromonas sp. 5E99-2 TaxID=2817683 RepID=UPI001A98EA1C|nr:TetR/AcrR family transcriptional regulator [Alteromonas sp. 5E99-2]MBO1257024.1 TetR/AcrR family transcriptional regulator [Alteromonas sp. 5E99-2]
MAAAQHLLSSGDFPLPSVNQIINQAGVAKGTVYLYFSSREEIYLSLLMNYFTQFESDVLNRLSISNSESVSQVLADCFVHFSAQSPKGVYLACIAPLILENNLSDEFILKFKHHMHNITLNILTKIQKISLCDDLEELRIKFLLVYNLFLSSWQHCHPPENVLKVINKQGLGTLLYDFEKEFTRGLKAIWQ